MQNGAKIAWSRPDPRSANCAASPRIGDRRRGGSRARPSKEGAPGRCGTARDHASVRAHTRRRRVPGSVARATRDALAGAPATASRDPRASRKDARTTPRRRHRARYQARVSTGRRTHRSFGDRKGPPVLVRDGGTAAITRAFDHVLDLHDARAEDLPDDAVMHQVRTAASELAFFIGLFSGCLPARWTRLAAELHGLQTRLGTLHDHVLAIVRVQHWMKRGKPVSSIGLHAYVAKRETARARTPATGVRQGVARTEERLPIASRRGHHARGRAGGCRRGVSHCWSGPKGQPHRGGQAARLHYAVHDRRHVPSRWTGAQSCKSMVAG